LITSADRVLRLRRAGSDRPAGEALTDLADRVSNPAAVATGEWLRLSMRLAVAERELAAAVAGSEHAYGPKMAKAFVAMIERMMPSILQARQTAEQCLAIARSREA